MSATEFAATTFARRRDAYVFPAGVGEVDYLVVDTRDRWLAGALKSRQTTLESVLSHPDYDRVYGSRGFLVYRKRLAPG